MRNGYGGPGNRNPDRSGYRLKRHTRRCRPCPDDFRERYIELGWEAQYFYETGWRQMARWLDECGGQELIDARKQWLRENGRNWFHRYG